MSSAMAAVASVRASPDTTALVIATAPARQRRLFIFSLSPIDRRVLVVGSYSQVQAAKGSLVGGKVKIPRARTARNRVEYLWFFGLFSLGGSQTRSQPHQEGCHRIRA